MFSHNKYIFIVTIITFGIMYAAENKKNLHRQVLRSKYPSGQYKLYNNKDIFITIKNNLLAAQKNYENKQYAYAALLAKGALTYASVMNIENNIHTEDKNIFNYIISDCHLNYLNSPQHALDSLRKIHDVETTYGKIESNTIAQSLYKKAQDIELTDQRLYQKLHLEGHYYAINNVYQSYQKLLTNQNNQQQDFLIKQCKKILDKQNKLRLLIFKLLNSRFISIKSFVNQIFSLESDSDFNEIISSFIKSDKHFIIPILKKQIENNSYHSNYFYYLLGLLYYYNHNYKNAFLYLTKTKIYSSDINTKCKVLKAFAFNKLYSEPSHNDALEGINLLYSLFNQIISNQKKLTLRNQNTFFRNLSAIKFYSMNWAQILIDNKDYNKLFNLISLYVQLPQTYLTGIQIITLIHNKLRIDNNIDINSIETKFFQTIIEHFTQHRDLESLQCLSAIITHNILQQKSTYKRLDKKITIKCIKYALKNNIYSQKEKEKLEAVCGRLYYQLSKKESQENLKNNYFNKSLHYNAHKTLLELASTILDKNNKNSIFTPTENMFNAMEILNKVKNLTKEHNSLSLRIKALNVLASIPFLLTLNSENKTGIEFPGDFIFNCIKKSYELGDTEYLHDLSFFYLFGIKDKNNPNQWILPPNLEKACEVFEHLLKIDDSPSIYFDLAKIYYIRGQNYFDKSFLYFNKFQKNQPTLNNLKKDALCYMSSIKLHTLDPQSILESASYIDQAIPLENIMSFSLGDFINEDLYLNALSDAQNLIKKDNTEKYFIELCALLGQIFYHQERYKNNPTIQTQASACLRYAAKHNNIKAKMYIVFFNDLNVHPWEKIKYIKDIFNATVHTQNYKLIYNNLEPLFYDLYPKKIDDRYEYIKYLKEKGNEKELEDYLESIYFGFVPLEKSCYYTTTDKNLAQLFYEDTILKKYIDEFNQHNNKNSIPHHLINTIFIYSYALMNSDDPKIITLSASYFNKLQEFPSYKTNPIIQKLLSICFYKLGKHYESNNNFLAYQYLTKSVNLNNEDAIIDISRKWLQNDSMLKNKNINVNKVTQWLHAIKNESNKIIVDDLIKQCSEKNKSAKRKKNKKAIIIVKKFNTYDTHVQNIFQTLIQKASLHDYLIANHKSPELLDSLFQGMLEIHDKVDQTNKLAYIALYHHHPHAAMLTVSKIYKENLEKTKFYLELAFKNGIIASSSDSTQYVFKDLTFLKILSNFIIIIKENPYISFLSYIKERLHFYKINLDYLTEYIFDLKDYDLNKCKEWNS